MGIDMLNQLMCDIDEEVLANSKEKMLKEISEKLSNGEFLWQQGLIDQIKDLYKDEKVVVFDMDGVLIGFSKEQGSILNPEVELVVNRLNAGGYKVVLWTSAMRSGLEESLPPEVRSLFDLTITRENYFLTSGDYVHTGIPKRGGAAETYYHELIKGYESYSYKQRDEAQKSTRQVKRPELLFTRSVLLDDDFLHVTDGIKVNLPEGKIVVCDYDTNLFFSQLNLLKYSAGAICGDIQSGLRYLGVWVVGEVEKLFDDFENRKLNGVK